MEDHKGDDDEVDHFRDEISVEEDCGLLRGQGRSHRSV